MNRDQAKNLLDAYEDAVKSRRSVDKDKVTDSLKRVIIDAMCETDIRYYPVYVGSNSNTPPWPKNPYYPTITYTSGTGGTTIDTRKPMDNTEATLNWPTSMKAECSKPKTEPTLADISNI